MASDPSPSPEKSDIPPQNNDKVELLFRSEAARLQRFFHRRTGDREAASDLMQETFLRLAGAKRCGELVNPLSYLQRIARNLLIDRSRRTATRIAGLFLPYDEIDETGVEPDQAYALEAEELRARYERALDRLTEKSRHIFLLHRVSELTYAQISDSLDISIGTVEYHIGRALSHLDRELGDD